MPKMKFIIPIYKAHLYAKCHTAGIKNLIIRWFHPSALIIIRIIINIIIIRVMIEALNSMKGAGVVCH